MNKFSYLFFLAVIAFLSFAILGIVLGDAMHEIGYSHIIAAVLGGIAIVFSLKIKKRFGKIMGKSYNFVILGIVMLTISHLSEYVLEIFNVMTHNVEYVLHFFFSLGMLFLIYAFYKLIQESPGD